MSIDLQRHAWHGGQLLAFSELDGPTSYDHSLVARTLGGSPGLEFRLPARGKVEFLETSTEACRVAGDWFELGQQTRGAFADAFHLLIEGPCRISGLEAGLEVRTEGLRTLIGSAARFDAAWLQAPLEPILRARQRWLEAQRLPADLAPAARRTLGKALSQMKTQVCSPEGDIRHRWTTPDRWPHRMMWLWDSAFHAIGWRHLDASVARDALLAVLDRQRADGFIAHMMSPRTASEITQPPVLAFAVKLVHDTAPDPAWLARTYPALCAYLRWDMAHRDHDGAGLLEWAIEGNPFCRSGESGMDNSPRFDAATAMDAVDFNAFLALECETLAELAGLLGKDDDAAQWRSEHARLCRLLRERLWSEEHRFFVDYDVERHAPSSVLASSGFLPLVCGAATPAQAAALVAHLADPLGFGTAFPIPSIAKRDHEHYAKDMWRGPVWINLNWLVARGLARYGYREEAAALRRRTQQEIERCCEQYATLFEFYDDRGECDPPQLLRKGRCAPDVSPYHQVFHDYGWTATLYADWAYSRADLALDAAATR